MTNEKLVALGKLIYNKIEQDYTLLKAGKPILPAEMMSNRLLGMISDKDKDALLIELAKAQKELEVASKAENIDAIEVSADAKIADLDKLI